jgi:hypothetical protein
MLKVVKRYKVPCHSASLQHFIPTEPVPVSSTPHHMTTISSQTDDRGETGTYVYPKNARSFFALSPESAAEGIFSVCSISSVGKYDVSVIDLRLGTKGASISRMEAQSTP